MACPHTDEEHEASVAHATTTLATFHRIAKERQLCMGACHASLMCELMEEIAARTETPQQFVNIIVQTMFAATGFKVSKIEGVMECGDESVH